MAYLISILLVLFNFAIDNNPEELGKVKWLRDYNLALQKAKSQQKPVFILFQEVPGCSTCKNYGNNILSHPLIVEAIEDEFIPLVIYNNKKGKDAEILRKYREPSWNNPVVRIVDQSGKNIVKRLSGNYSKLGIINTIRDGILGSNRIVPSYLDLLAEEFTINADPLKESYLSMYCFWTGEKVLANIPGIAETEAGFMDGKEVVKFKYNPELVEYDNIVKEASQNECADMVYSDNEKERNIARQAVKIKSSKTSKYRKDKNPKYYLSNSKLKYIPMTKFQSMKINSALGKSQVAIDFLSPRQIRQLNFIKLHKEIKWEEVYEKDIYSSWWKVQDKIKA